MRKFLFPLAVAATACLLAWTPARAQQLRIGFVNSAKIFAELPAAQDAQKRLDGLSKTYQDSLADMQKDLQARYEDYQKKEALMNDATKKSEQQKLMEIQQRANDYRVEKFGNDGELARQTEKIVGPIRDKIKAAIATIAKEEKYSFVFDKTEQVQVLLYGDPNQDLTFKVLDRLRRGH